MTESRESIAENLVDSTPDGGYAIRILEAFRKRCDCLWSMEGEQPWTIKHFDRFNERQRQRAKELDAALRVLRSGISIHKVAQPIEWEEVELDADAKRALYEDVEELYVR